MASNKTPNLGLDIWAELDFFKRAEMNNNFTKVDSKIGILQTFSVNVKAYGAKGDYDPLTGTGSDDTEAFKKAISDLRKFQNGTNYSLPPELLIPNGSYKITDTLDFSPLAGHSASTALKPFYRIRGASTQSTKIYFTKDNSIGFFFNKCQLKMEDMFIRHLGIKGTAMKFGSTEYRDPADNILTVVNQSHLANLRISGNPTAVEQDYLFDTTFQDCHFSSIQNNTNTDTSVAVFKVNPLTEDMNNHTTFLRCHWEGTYSNSTQFKCVGTANSVIHTFNFIGCHFETRNLSVRNFELEYVKGLNFSGCVFMRNGYYTEDQQTTERANVIKDAWSVTFNTCNFNGTNTITKAPYLSLVGAVYGLDISNTIMNGTTYYDIPKYVDSSGVTDVASSSGTWHFNILRGSSATASYQGKKKSINSDVGFRRFEQQYASVKGIDSLVTQYSTTQQSTPFDENTLNFMSFNQNGVLSTGGYTSNTQKMITTNGSYTFVVPSSNSNKRGLFMVMMDNSAEVFALVFSTGTSLVPISVGNSAVVGTTLPSPTTSNRMYVYLNGKDIAVTNTFASDRYVMLVPFVF